jgi:mono/diheme cytochrome c family protein
MGGIMLTRVALAVALLASGSAAWAADGAQIYEQKCKVCHSIGGVGGAMAKVGGPLDNVGATRDEAWLKAYMADPKSKMPDAKMPKLNLSPADLDAVTKYMLTLKGAPK